MAPDIFYFFQAMGVKLRNMYGMTEIGLMTVHTGEQYSLETVGHFMYVTPAFGAPLEWRVEETGELLVRGGWGFDGYYNNPGASAERLKGKWFCTGDALAIREDGEMVYLERVSDMRQLSTGVRFPPQFIEIRLRFSPFIKDVISLGDETKPFVSALINIDSETVGRWAEKRGIAYSTFPDLSQKPDVLRLIKGEIDRVNRSLLPESRVLRFANLPKELDPDEAELTRTRKLRRSFLEERFGGLINAIYERTAAFATEVPVKYRDGRTGMVKTDVGITDTEAGKEAAK
jgi:long-chain acyl-CoA synthetase